MLQAEYKAVEGTSASLNLDTIWTVNPEDTLKKGTGMKVFDSTKISPQIETGGRLQMDEIYNQLEGLQTELRRNAAIIGFTVAAYKEMPRAAGFNMKGLTEMLAQVRRHYSMFTEYIVYGNMQRELVLERSTAKETSSEFKTRAADVLGEQDTALQASHGFSIVLTEFCNEWEKRMDAVQNILTPPSSSANFAAPKIDVAPFFLEQLSESIRESRMTIFMIYLLYQEATNRPLDANLR